VFFSDFECGGRRKTKRRIVGCVLVTGRKMAKFNVCIVQ
jgi:hypothetical protein